MWRCYYNKEATFQGTLHQLQAQVSDGFLEIWIQIRKFFIEHLKKF